MAREFIQHTPAGEPTHVDRLSPQNGDVVVTREAHSRVHYTVRQYPGIVQFSTGALDDAVRLARGFARRHAVDVWYSEAGASRLLETCRPRSARPDVAEAVEPGAGR
jgi:hypothetical protein